MSKSEFTSERKLLISTLAILGATVALGATDVVLDLFEGASLQHLFVEVGVIVAGVVGLWVVSRHLRAVTRRGREVSLEAEALSEELRASQADARRWRREAQELVHGLGRAIDMQFDAWELTPAEKEVALLLMKGLSHKDVAEVRSVAETTTRQQARAVYKKAGLRGRNDLSAFFLEDLVLPSNLLKTDKP